MSKIVYICKRSMSSSSTRNVLRIERTAVKRNSGAFESHSNSATAQHRSKDDRGRTMSLQNVPTETTAGQTFQSSTTINNKETADRLKCDALQSSAGESAAEVSRFGGRILRKEERKAPGGSLAVQTSATVTHRKNRIHTEDMVVTNPSNISIPILDAQTSESEKSIDDKSRNPKDEDSMEDTVQNEAAPSDVGTFGKVVVFLAGTSTGLAVASYLV